MWENKFRLELMKSMLQVMASVLQNKLLHFIFKFNYLGQSPPLHLVCVGEIMARNLRSLLHIFALCCLSWLEAK